ncbi:unnamed protein product [Vitrella brassicaformis CCMP3155]|uniref:Dynein light chain n=2 Tax=Vitrella brassicaformis TaxID=1169539 RepID=A0A0G4G742_VITBC|nr:unnamed protein product [Vitrella brassicaformis CCMP3155]|mmetsp:Transcript_15223/g.36235  ORF Transcript_15223/g.36235 Transcript_15223/m.36235 type:complete len:343 (+) Transcript_15223:167-1195(+)|eukprot:CEM24039.1 unnamed protein product [Vitrella brassicaformis CCMP3155]
MSVVKIFRSDLPKKDQKFVRDAIVALDEQLRLNTKDGRVDPRADEFAAAIQRVLDKRFQPSFHVLVGFGTQLGYALKYRPGTMGLFRLNETTVLVYKSPRVEILPSGRVAGAPSDPAAPHSEEYGASRTDSGATPAEDDSREDGSPGGKRIRVVEASPDPDDQDSPASCAVKRALSIVTQRVKTEDTKDFQLLAQEVRRQLTDQLGPIWHVMVGRDFVTCRPKGCRSYLLLQWGRHRVQCYQHEQGASQGGLLGLMMKGDMWGFVTFLAMVLFFLVLTFRKQLCGVNAVEIPSDFGIVGTILTDIYRTVCSEAASDVLLFGLFVLFVASMAMKFVKARMKRE